MKAFRLFLRERRAHDARRMADDERHFLQRAQRRGDEKIALVLAVVIIGDDHHLSPGEGGDDRIDTLVDFAHRFPHSPGRLNGQAGFSPICPRWRK